MPLCTTLHILLGNGGMNSSASTCHAVLGAFSAIITSIFRVILLLFCLTMGQNSILVTLNPPGEITANATCQSITVVKSNNHFSSYQKSSLDTKMFMTKLTPMEKKIFEYSGYEGGGSLYYQHQNKENSPEFIHQTYLFGYGQFWFTFKTGSDSTPKHFYSYDGEGYQLFYYYCGDVSSYLNTTWLPFMAWLLVNILPVITLSIIVLLFTLKSRCFLTSCVHPGMILSAILSHFHIGPVSGSKSNSGYLSLSPSISCLNILITFLGMCLNLHLTTAGFGNGDGRHLRFILPIFVCIPVFLISAIFAICFLFCFCCKGHTKKSIFNPSDPGRWYIVDTEDNVVPEEENLGMDDVPYAKMSA